MLRAVDRRKLEQLARRRDKTAAALLEAMLNAQKRGATLREIGQAVGLSHTGVRRLLTEAKRRRHD
jgi:DNA-binding IclR family transcriptional regulator